MVGLLDDLGRLCSSIVENTILLPYTLYKKNKEKALEDALKNDLESFYGKEIDLYCSLIETFGENKYRIIFKDGSRTELNCDVIYKYRANKNKNK